MTAWSVRRCHRPIEADIEVRKRSWKISICSLAETISIFCLRLHSIGRYTIILSNCLYNVHKNIIFQMEDFDLPPFLTNYRAVAFNLSTDKRTQHTKLRKEIQFSRSHCQSKVGAFFNEEAATTVEELRQHLARCDKVRALSPTDAGMRGDGGQLTNGSNIAFANILRRPVMLPKQRAHLISRTASAREITASF